MFHRWCIGLILGAGLAAGQPSPARTQAWVLALDARGGLVGDLKPAELTVKAGGKVRPISFLKTPAETAAAFQSWVLVFEPIRDTGLRAGAFTAAADFLTKVPEGDRVLIVARGKDSLESLMPGFSVQRSQWARALAKVPDMLPEGLVGSPKETLQGMGFQAAFTDTPEGPEGQEALNALLARFQAGAPGWAKGTHDQRGVSVLDRLNLNSPTFITGLIATVTRESKALGSLIEALTSVPGQKHLVVFSRCESDDMAHPSIKRAMTQFFKRERGDLGGPAESAGLITRDLTLIQSQTKARAVAAGVTIYSVAGAGQNVQGLLGTVAPATGGYVFPLGTGLESRFGQAIQVFGSRHLVAWVEEAIPAEPGNLEITTTRKDVKVFVQSMR
ncbi:MAG TPA: hypothetical protein DHV93_03195 [Holophagaceae bacterium]|nr:hypothetical protein [Holophagaceae bacterium]